MKQYTTEWLVLQVKSFRLRPRLHVTQGWRLPETPAPLARGIHGAAIVFNVPYTGVHVERGEVSFHCECSSSCGTFDLGDAQKLQEPLVPAAHLSGTYATCRKVG